MGKGDPKRKRGRPRKEDVPRTASGRISRASPADIDAMERITHAVDPRQIVWAARARMIGVAVVGPVPKAIVTDHRLSLRGDQIGRWEADDCLTAEQAAAARAYALLRHRYRVAAGLPPESPAAARTDRVDGSSATTLPEIDSAALRAFPMALRALQARGAAVAMAMHRAAVLDQLAPLHLIRLGCDALLAHGLR